MPSTDRNTSSQAIYTIENLQHQYGNRTILSMDDLQVRSGELLAIVGPSGAGKSTLLRLLALLETPTSGEVWLHIDGQSYSEKTASVAIRRHMAMVFQKPYLLSRSVRANVAYGLRVRGNRNDAVQIDEILQRFAIDHLQHAQPRELSGGELQRVALARSIILEPRVLLLDEPTANLDPYNVRLIEDLLQEQRQSRNMTIIMVTHNIFQARRMADRVVFLFDGKLVETATASDFFENPQNPRTAAFLSGELVY